MSGRADSDTGPQTVPEEAERIEGAVPHEKDIRADQDRDQDPAEDGDTEDTEDTEDAEDAEDDAEEPREAARRARWTAAGAGALLTLAGLTASLLRLAGPAPAPVAAAYAAGGAVCACAAFLGARGRTRRALWLLIAGVMVMALGDQFD
ncbi:hypothetical protein ACFQE4_22760 [Streptomyces thermocoprophilus]|uniref:Uncharacterized protein n=1 Tax=Streptomyces thermocoprophilus TaxID=78356 RepID=A0ABV5VNJ6_9ACTN